MDADTIIEVSSNIDNIVKESYYEKSFGNYRT